VFRVLRPGGRLVLVDVIRNAPATHWRQRAVQDLTGNIVARKLVIPPANADQRNSYAAKLSKAGCCEASAPTLCMARSPMYSRLRES
jgi:hypothetical protein